MKVLLLTLHSQNNNFGSVLQANSLYCYIKQLGYDVTILNYRPYYSNGASNFRLLLKKILTNILFLPDFVTRSYRFDKILKSEKSTSKYTKIEQLKILADKYDVFMIGSDQVWNPSYLCGKDPAYVLAFSDSEKKIAYAASIGLEKIQEPELNELINNIKTFKYVSVREKISSVQLINAGRIDARFVLDPVFLFDVEHYRTIQTTTSEKKYILAYVIHKDPFIEEVINIMAKKLNKKVIQVGGFASKCSYDKFPRGAGPAEFLGLIDGADFIITSSFHGTAFSHIYHKQFLVVLPYENTLRLTNILEVAGTTNRIIEKTEDLEKILEPIDYREVDKRIEALKGQSREFLESSLKAMEEI